MGLFIQPTLIKFFSFKNLKSLSLKESKFTSLHLYAKQRKTRPKQNKSEQSRIEENLHFPSTTLHFFTKCVLLVAFISFFLSVHQISFLSCNSQFVFVCRVLRRDFCREFVRTPSIRHPVDASQLCTGRHAFTGYWRTKLTCILSTEAVNQKH